MHRASAEDMRSTTKTKIQENINNRMPQPLVLNSWIEVDSSGRDIGNEEDQYL